MTINEWGQLCFNKTLFIKTAGGLDLACGVTVCQALAQQVRVLDSGVLDSSVGILYHSESEYPWWRFLKGLGF